MGMGWWWKGHRVMVITGWQQWRGQGEGGWQGSRAVTEGGGAMAAVHNSPSITFGPWENELPTPAITFESLSFISGILTQNNNLHLSKAYSIFSVFLSYSFFA